MTHATPARVFLDAGGHAPLPRRPATAFARGARPGLGRPATAARRGPARPACCSTAPARRSPPCVGARTEEVDLAPSHTAALHGAVRRSPAVGAGPGRDVVVGAVERAAVLHAADFVARDGGARDGRRGPRTAASTSTRSPTPLAHPGVALAALQHANGEVGTLQPVDAVHDAARARRGARCSSTRARASGHVDVGDAWDVLAADPGDWGGPAGSASSSTRAGVRRSPDWPEDEDRWFPGGVSVPAALAAAVALAGGRRARGRRTTTPGAARSSTGSGARVGAEVPDVEVVGRPGRPAPARRDVLVPVRRRRGAASTALDRLGFAVGSGSACTSSALEPSHVLAAMGVLTHGNVRLALPRDVQRRRTSSAFLDVLPGRARRARVLGVRPVTGPGARDGRTLTRTASDVVVDARGPALPRTRDPARAGGPATPARAPCSPCSRPTPRRALDVPGVGPDARAHRGRRTSEPEDVADAGRTRRRGRRRG